MKEKCTERPIPTENMWFDRNNYDYGLHVVIVLTGSVSKFFLKASFKQTFFVQSLGKAHEQNSSENWPLRFCFYPIWKVFARMLAKFCWRCVGCWYVGCWCVACCIICSFTSYEKIKKFAHAEAENTEN
jgi:hypothetical protein